MALGLRLAAVPLGLSNLVERFFMNDSNAARPQTGKTCRLTTCWLACLTLALISTTAAAQDDDVVIFNNGDRLTGEIRGLARGFLSFNTDATGTIQIEWTEVAELRSDQSFEIYLISGQRYNRPS